MSRIDRLRDALGGRLAFGGDWNPEQWPEETWADDLRLMRRAGVNLVTVGVFSWAKLQPSPGEFDFGWLDRVLEQTHEAGIAVCLATATASPPPWLARRHPETLPVTNEGVRLEVGARQHYCPSSPVFRDATVQMCTAMADRYGRHPALALWHVSNEYGAHVDACYCDVSGADFRRWLKERYGDIAALNDAWGTAFWSQQYGSFDEIAPPRKAPYFPNPAQQLDFRRFSSDALLRCHLAEFDVLRRVTPDMPVTTNFMGLFKPLDYFEWSKHEDLVSHDAYPDLETDHPEIDAALWGDLMRSLRHGQSWYLMEQAAGAINWRARNPPKPSGVNRLWSMQAVARGADAVMYFQWRASRRGAEKFHSAMLPHAGADSRVFGEIAQLGDDLQRLTSLVGREVAADVAIVMSWDSWWALELDSRPSTDLKLVDQIRSYYDALWGANVTVDFRSPDDDLSAYRLVVVPNLYLVTARQAAAMTDYVMQGGHVVMSFFSGIVDEYDGIHLGGYPAPFRDMLGIRVEEFWPLRAGASVEVEFVDGPAGMATCWSEMVYADEADVVAQFGSGDLWGQPAATRHRAGKGSATYLATRLDGGLMRHVMSAACTQAGVTPVLPATPSGIEAVRRGDALFLLNHTSDAIEVGLPGPGTNLITGKRHESTVLVAPRGVAAVVPMPS